MSNTVVITRHPALVDLLIKRGLITGDTPVISHASPDMVSGKHVIGVLPLSLASLAASITEVPLTLRPDQRGRELALDELEAAAGDAVTYKVTRQ